MKDLKGLILQVQLFVCTPLKCHIDLIYHLMHFTISQLCQAAHMHNPNANLLSYPKLARTSQHPCPLYTTSSCPGASTGAEHLWIQTASLLSLHCLNKEAKSMKNGLSRSHSSNQGMLSSAFSHSCDLSSILDPWHLVSLAKLFLESHGIRHL